MTSAARIRVDRKGLVDIAGTRRSVVVTGVECTHVVQVDTSCLDGDYLRVRVRDARDGAALIELPVDGGRTVVVRVDTLLDDDTTPGCVIVAAVAGALLLLGAIAAAVLK